MMDPRDLQMAGTRPFCKAKSIIIGQDKVLLRAVARVLLPVELSFLDTKHRNQRGELPL